MHFVYVLISKFDHMLYIGETTNLNKRIDRHSKGHVPATKHRLPLELIYYEAYTTSKEAKRRERYLKGGNGRAVLKTQLHEKLRDYDYKYL